MMILQKLKGSGFKIITISFVLLLAAFILAQVVCVVTYTTPQVLIKSLASREIWFAIKLSLITAVISTILCIIISVPAAYALVRYDFPGKSFFNTILDMPLALPPLVAGVGLLILFGTTPFGKALAKAGLVFVYTPLGIIIAQFFVNVPFMLRILKSTFQGINPRYEYIAQGLGCTEAQAFWRVTLPMSKNGLLAGSVITWSKGIGEFGAALMVAGATRMKTEILPISLYLNMSCGELDLAIAAATILIVISFASLFIFERYSGTVHFL
ncbi:MAG: molybdate transport system permease protein [Desulfobacteraceae bacterium Eth-SRB1]|nr:MAG: molybdate transport system permease protein [Desulfobacteraceae bacterium Eth-SRB1]